MASHGRPLGRIAGLIFIVVAFAIVTGCAGCNPQSAQPIPVGTAGASEVSFCNQACSKYVKLGCIDATVCTRYAEPTDACAQSQTCEQWCADSVTGGAPAVVKFHPKCIANVDVSGIQGSVCDAIKQACSR